MDDQSTNIMAISIERLLAAIWNVLAASGSPKYRPSPALHIGFAVTENGVTSRRVGIALNRRAEHMVILGRTGSGKSSAMKHMATQDIRAGRGFLWFDHHGDSIPFLLQQIRTEEERHGKDLSERTILIDPSDPVASVGLNFLEFTGQSNFVLIAEFARILKQRWGLEHFGARTEELLRNSLYVLADSKLTLLELSPLLTNASYRRRLLLETKNTEVVQYFETRYGQASESMQAVMRDPILNKVSYITSDPAFRHILGQRHSTLDLVSAIDSGAWVLLNVSKGQLGEQAQTLGSFFLAKFKTAIFRRRNRNLFSAYCDEIQNLIAYEDGFETLLSEARKFAIGIISANQFLDQIPPTMRAAMLAVQTHLVFRLSAMDAEKIGRALNGDRKLADRLLSLPQRHAVMQSASEGTTEVEVPHVAAPNISVADLTKRVRARWAKPREVIERDIKSRQPRSETEIREALNDWD